MTPVNAVHDVVAVSSLWGGVRVVVIDIETTRSPGGGGPLRVVSVAAVTCRGGSVRGKWQRLVNPQVPIDSVSQAIHGITDQHVEGEPAFADVAASLLSLLTPKDGEQLVLCAHNVGFDVGVLRHELELVGIELPDLPVLDTMGKLANLVGVHPPTRSLSDLIATLGITNSRPHDAMADAVACADAAVELLSRAAAQGRTDFDVLLAEVSDKKTTSSIRASKKSFGGLRSRAKALPPTHMEGHSEVLSLRAGVTQVKAWQVEVAECSALRCRHLDQRVLQAEAPVLKRMEALEVVLEDLCTANDTAGAATVLGAMTPLLAVIDPYNTTTSLRSYVMQWVLYWSPRLTPLGRCSEDDYCPACRRHEACPLDAWPDFVGPLALGPAATSAKGFFQTSGVEVGTGGYTTWKRRGVDERVVDAVLFACTKYLRSISNGVKADQIVRLAWKVGCRHPDIADAWSGLLATPGRLGDLEAATRVCNEALKLQDGSTSDAWLRLISRRSQLAGRAQRLAFRPSGSFDEDGEPIPARSHHPSTPRRTRTPRFIREPTKTYAP